MPLFSDKERNVSKLMKAAIGEVREQFGGECVRGELAFGVLKVPGLLDRLMGFARFATMFERLQLCRPSIIRRLDRKCLAPGVAQCRGVATTRNKIRHWQPEVWFTAIRGGLVVG